MRFNCSAGLVGVVLLVLLASFGEGSSITPDDYEDDNDHGKDTREFMIPYPRLGRYMDYAVLKVLAEYLKENYNYNELLQLASKLPAPETALTSDMVLQRDLRDMKGKGYGIPIPRVGRRRRSVSDSGEQMPISGGNGIGITNDSVRTLWADLLRATFDNKRQQSPSRLLQFKPRVGRADKTMMKYGSGKYSNWAPVPRVGKR